MKIDTDGFRYVWRLSYGLGSKTSIHTLFHNDKAVLQRWLQLYKNRLGWTLVDIKYKKVNAVWQNVLYEFYFIDGKKIGEKRIK